MMGQRRTGRVAAALAMIYVFGVGGPSPLAAEEGANSEEFSLEGIRVDVEGQVVRLEASLCLREGILEYVAVSRRGKTYESLFELKARPSQIHAALILAGLEPRRSGEKAGPDDTPLRIKVKWEKGTLQRDGNTVPVEELLTDRSRSGKAEALTWRFTGSILGPDIDGKPGETVYVADLERSVIAIWPDQTAVLNLIQKSRNPYRGDTYGFEARTNSLPKLGEEAWLVIERAAP